MTESVAWSVLVTMAAVAAVVWLITAAGFFALVRPRRGEEEKAVGPWSEIAGGGDGANWSTRTVELEGRPEQLAERLASSLAREGLGGCLVRVLSRTKDQVSFEVLPQRLSPVGVCASIRSARRGETSFTSVGSGRARAAFQIEHAGGRGLVLAGAVFVALGAVAIAGLFLLLSTFAVPSPRPGVRGQVVQMVQCVHFLWPPWLFGLLNRRGQNQFLDALQVRIANLPFVSP